MSRFVIKALNTTTCGVFPVRFANTPPKYKKKVRNLREKLISTKN